MFDFLKRSPTSKSTSGATLVGNEEAREPIYPQPTQVRQQQEIVAQREVWSQFFEKHPFDITETWLWQYWKAESRIENQLQKKLMTIFNSKAKLQATMKKMIRGGIPPELRGQIWYACSGAREKQALAAPEQQFDALCAQLHTLEGTEVGHDIDKDLLRTFPSHPWLHSEEGLAVLKRILGAYAIRNPKIGYCQSMNYLCALLMFHLPDEQVFWVLASIIEDILAPDYYAVSMLGSRVDQQVFHHLVKKKLPQVQRVLVETQTNLDPILCPWFLCLYINILPLATVCRIWDCFFWEGNHVLFRIGLSMLHSKKDIMGESSDPMLIYMALKSGSGGPRLGSFELEGTEDDGDADGSSPSSTSRLVDIAYDKRVLGNVSRKMLSKYRGRYLAVISKKDEELSTKTAEFHAAEAELRQSKALNNNSSSGSSNNNNNIDGNSGGGIASEVTADRRPSQNQQRRRSLLVAQLIDEKDPSLLKSLAAVLDEGVSDTLSVADSDEGDGSDDDASSHKAGDGI